MLRKILTTACLAWLAVVPVVASAAMPACKSHDPVVWVNTKSKVFYMKGASMYGKTVHGNYVCQSAAMSAGDHQAKMGAMGSGMTGSSMGATGSMGTTNSTMGHPMTGSSSSPKP
jgi:hypothetical protein